MFFLRRVSGLSVQHIPRLRPKSLSPTKLTDPASTERMCITVPHLKTRLDKPYVTHVFLGFSMMMYDYCSLTEWDAPLSTMAIKLGHIANMNKLVKQFGALI